MNRKSLMKRWTAITMALLGVFWLAGISAAADAGKQEQILDKVSQEGYMAMQEAGFARVAIFDGQLDEAVQLLEKARLHLATAKKNAPELSVTVKAVEKMGNKTIDSAKMTETNDLIPIDAALTLADDFISTPEKTAKIKEANEHMKKGEHAKAHEILKEAGIGVSVSRVLMPLDFVTSQIEKADSLMKDHKYYEANLALKGATESLIVDTVLLYEPAPAKKKK